MPELLEMRGVSKLFPGVRATRFGGTSRAQGGIHALMGEKRRREEHADQGADRRRTARRRSVLLDGDPIDPVRPPTPSGWGSARSTRK